MLEVEKGIMGERQARKRRRVERKKERRERKKV